MKLSEALALCTTDAEKKTAKSIWQGHYLANKKKDSSVNKETLELPFTEEQLKERLAAKPAVSFKSIMKDFNLTQKEALELLKAAAQAQYEKRKAYYDLQAQQKEIQKKLKEMRASFKK